VGPKGDTGSKGDTGTAGAAGNNVLNGSGAPNDSFGANGDFYIDTTANKIYGPKAAGAWPLTGTSLVGPTFADYRAGQAIILATTSSVAVTFSSPVSGPDYLVSLTYEGVPSTRGWVVVETTPTAKGTAGFTIDLVDSGGALVDAGAGGVIVDWIVMPSK
jgi:hypothetical protein